MKSLKIAAVTLMRKGSKRLPNKPVKTLKGIPLFMHTVNFAEKLGYPYYLAHDYEYLDLPEFVTEIKRHPEYAGAKHDTNNEILSFGLDADIYIFLQVTSPFRDVQVYKKCINAFIENLDKLDVGFAAHECKSGYYHFSDTGGVNYIQEYRDDNGMSRHDLFPLYRETGAFYIFKRSQLYKKHILSGIKDRTVIIKDEYDIDINTEKDLLEAELCELK